MEFKIEEVLAKNEMGHVTGGGAESEGKWVWDERIQEWVWVEYKR